MQSYKNNQASSQQHKRISLKSEAFPALSSSDTPTAPPQWIKVSKSKEKIKPVKSEPPQRVREPAFNPVADFPTLPVNVSKSKAKKQPQQQPRPLPQSRPQQPPGHGDNGARTASKKEKKKPNNNVKREAYVDFSNVNGETNVKNIGKELSRLNFNNNNITDSSNGIIERKVKTIVETEIVDDVKRRNGENENFAIAPNDYPPLNPKTRPNERTAPPGFESRPPCDGMTFTNSAGETFEAPPHAYIPPPDFERRNRDLVNEFVVALGGAAAVDRFKLASRAFRDDLASAAEFYSHCEAALGSRLRDAFPELIALLPDIRKQQELVAEARRASPDACEHLHVCAACGQLLSPSDVAAHDSAHWPPLASR